MRRTVSDLRDMRSEIKDLFHPLVSRMGKDALIHYVYMSTKHLDCTTYIVNTVYILYNIVQLATL
eukprot:COSAG02_NODE_309_length_25051_cov_5.385460_14_plen_65_part_00